MVAIPDLNGVPIPASNKGR